MNLVIDMGNSRLKWAIAQRQQLQNSAALANNALSEPHLMALWAALPRPERVFIGCVSAHSQLAVVEQVIAQLWHCPVERVLANAACNSYAQPERLGVDRWLALLAARHHYPLPVCVIDCGTALTVDVLDAQGEHQGGLISAGLQLMRSSLSGATAHLPTLTAQLISRPLALASDTQNAIAQGTVFAAVGFINNLAQHLDADMNYVMTGGDAPQLAAQLLLPVQLDSDLVLRGLALVASGYAP